MIPATSTQAKAYASPSGTLQENQVPERWFHVIRLGWWAFTLLYGALFVIGVPLYFRQLVTICDPGLCSSDAWWDLTTVEVQALQTWGISLTAYGIYQLAWEVLVAAIHIGAGFVLFYRRTGQRIALLTSFALVIAGAWMIPGSPHAIKHFYPSFLPFATLLWLPSLPAFAIVLFLLPNGRFEPTWSRWFAMLFCTYVAITNLLQPLGWMSADIFKSTSILSTLIAPVTLGVAIYGQVYRYRRGASAVERLQIKWVGFGAMCWIGGVSLFAAYVSLVKIPSGSARLAANLIGPAFISTGAIVFPVTLAVAILRYRLWGIDVILNRALVYGGVTAAIVSLYTLIVGGLSSVFHAQGNTINVFIGAGLVAILFQPLRERLQRGANRLMFGQRDEPYAVLAQFARQLETTPALETILLAIVTTIQETLKLSQVMIDLNHKGPPDTHSASNKELIPFPFFYQGTPIGRLLVAPREGETELSQKDQRLLEDLARQAGIAVHTANVTAELQRAREHLVTTREEERRRLRRDLHDGLGPTLATIATQSEAARDLIYAHPERSEALLDDIVTQAQTATADIRRLVYNLRPPALDDLGLIGALKAQAQKINRPGVLQVIVQVDALPPLPAAVEVAVYRIVQEALANVVHHAEAQNCLVCLQVEGEILNLEIRDNGRGLHPAAQPGVGLSSMRERAEELGGVCSVVMNGKGATVQARLPLNGERQG